HLLTKLGRPQEALAALDSAIAIRPHFARAHYERGVVLGLLGNMDEMRDAHARTVELQPDSPDALASLALLAARSGDTALARDYARRSLALSDRGTLARAALAVADIADGQFATAGRELDSALAEASPNDTWMDIALADAADAFDRQNEVSRAFAAYAAAGERRRSRQLRSVGHGRAIDAVLRRSAWFKDAEAWPLPSEPARPNPSRGHVFLLGFMRSGTTLLETVLACNPQVCASDERDFLAQAARRFLFSDEGLNRLAALDEKNLAPLHESYWKAVSEAGFAVADKIFVNKMPFNSLRLPLIAKLFPNARILLAIRDPRDVVFSCFRHRFAATTLTFEFLRLDDCARFYAATMEFVELCRGKLPLTFFDHRYENMIGHFDESVSDVCEFIGVDWSTAMREFVAASGVIAPRNPSAAQVRRGLYESGAGQWRRYRESLAPVIPILQPWIGRFGYPAA
ncbi:MAG: tetratricopeptide repeat-containing sulfotransferase family protein, partial [Rhizomicrobium sp.]